ncbi:TPA: hypothetical protein P6R15_003316 [Pseudomonas aeruginosa]|uniref:hypothetical protein n=1 Tax=Pseudomonas aeruginosa TaxID=287 RepID=UPI001EEE5602|nr:hypothetical protein [Pseudomonas aeruginosa]MCG7080646.1 hypothetical protein [Pseudomonas aeruginosa]MCG7084765.1 hypothetical protein [Pseudomonas aeruginosa]MCG7090858.1 hypothetical protein [Pseudomonas aeruginosa]MCG7096920.1 hypothetical protein [Pseudomonas aeruginosa]MCG7103598.1 hypothetical protein [Pseudomonas aeruginosa]
MMAADSLRSGVPSGMSFRWLLPCRRACRAGAFAPHVAPHPAQPSNVQASCLERARPVAFIASVRVFVGALAAHAAASPGLRCLERQRKAKAEGKTKGLGTLPRRKPVCTWGEHGTERLRRRAVFGAKVTPMQACPRASHDWTRQSLQGERP